MNLTELRTVRDAFYNKSDSKEAFYEAPILKGLRGEGSVDTAYMLFNGKDIKVASLVILYITGADNGMVTIYIDNEEFKCLKLDTALDMIARIPFVSVNKTIAK